MRFGKWLLRAGMAAALACALLAPETRAQSSNPKDLAVGKLLVAGAHVPDGRFHHAVVLLIAYSDKEAVGLVLNQPGATPLSRLFPDFASAQGRTDVAYAGGPVETVRLFCLLRIEGKLREAQPVLPGVYISDKKDLMQLALNAQEPAASFRVFQGYSGWGPGQLARELAAGYWTIVAGSAPLIFDPDPATLWSRLTAPAAPTPRPVRPAGAAARARLPAW